MAWILPKRTRRQVEWRLRNRWKMRDEAERLLLEAQSDAISLAGTLGHEGGGRSNLPGDPTGRGADRIIRARERVEAAEKWERVFTLAEEQFPPGSDHHKIISLRYWSGLRIAEIAEQMHYDRQTIVRKRDEFLTVCCFIAAEEGLTRRADDVSD